MSDLILATSETKLPVPLPKEELTIRPGTLDDLDNIDRLQKKYSKNLAFLPRKALEGKINRNEVLIAETGGRVSSPAVDSGSCGWGQPPSKPQFLGYLIGTDCYFKHDNVGIIYHLAVQAEKQRGFIGAALLKAQFDRSAPGCKLYCCWCAQDLSANYFYEALGFVPLAYRGGSESKERTHIFWEKRIREGDVSTPWWFPSETKGGMMAADRLVFPIPPGKQWSDELPLMFPKDTYKKIESSETSTSSVETVKVEKKTRKKQESAPAIIKRSYQPSVPSFVIAAPEKPIKEKPVREKPVKEKRAKIKNNPELVAKARDLKDRWLDMVNENPKILQSAGKYELTRQVNQKRLAA